jgi:hypothetical protein
LSLRLPAVRHLLRSLCTRRRRHGRRAKLNGVAVHIQAERDQSKEPPHRPPKRWRSIIFMLARDLLLFVIGVAVIVLLARPFMPRAIRWYVNRTLDQSVLYKGRIGPVTLHLWRGAYSIQDITISKTTSDIPVPLFTAKRLDLAVQWDALLHRKVVGEVVMIEPQVNFVDDPDPARTETGADGPWLKMLRDLFPFDLNSARVENGSIHFRTFAQQHPVDVYLSNLQVSVDDLQNVNRSLTPLIATVTASATAMDQATLDFKMKLDPFSYNPTFHLIVRLLGLDITQTNDLIEAYGNFNVKRGFFDLVLDIDCKEGAVTGYVKTLFRNMIVFDLLQDVQEDNPLQFFWQAIVGGATAIITNYNRDQLGTLIPFTGDIASPGIDVLATIGNVLRNAFIRAYLPRLEKTRADQNNLTFEPASILDESSFTEEP